MSVCTNKFSRLLLLRLDSVCSWMTLYTIVSQSLRRSKSRKFTHTRRTIQSACITTSERRFIAFIITWYTDGSTQTNVHGEKRNIFDAKWNVCLCAVRSCCVSCVRKGKNWMNSFASLTRSNEMRGMICFHIPSFHKYFIVCFTHSPTAYTVHMAHHRHLSIWFYIKLPFLGEKDEENQFTCKMCCVH